MSALEVDGEASFRLRAKEVTSWSGVCLSALPERQCTVPTLSANGLEIDTDDSAALKERAANMIGKHLGVNINIKRSCKIGIRTCLIELGNEVEKTAILRNRNKLKNVEPKKIWITEDLTKKEREKMKALRDKAREMRDKGKTNIAGLKNFFVFNSTLGNKEGEELKKILYYYPVIDNVDVQIKNVGLVEGIIQFTETFKPSTPVKSLRTTKTRHLYFQPEKDYWIVMTLQINRPSKEKDISHDAEELEDDVDDSVYEAILKQSYYVYRLFWNTFESSKDITSLKTSLDVFYRTVSTSGVEPSDMQIIYQYLIGTLLPANVEAELQGGSIPRNAPSPFAALRHGRFIIGPSNVKLAKTVGKIPKVYLFASGKAEEFHLVVYRALSATVCLFIKDFFRSGVEPSDMQIIYQYLIGTLLPANVEAELQGGSIPRNAPSPFAALRHGRFIIGPSNVKLAKTVGKIPKVYLFASGKAEEFHLVVYRALSATVCLFIKGDAELTVDLFKELDEFINSKLISIVSDIAEYCSKQVITPSNLPETAPRFIYFNKLNLAYKSTVHLDNKQSGNLSCPKEAMRIAAEMKANIPFLGSSGETIVKTMNDYWVVMKLSNNREFYIALQQKNASLIDINGEY
uniref:Vacuolar fusion protein CCZ1 homolog n=1 Tax=Diabrotica virgifera virgifera TaxID=50390 RepID=A0A6P7GP16_DIAVI